MPETVPLHPVLHPVLLGANQPPARFYLGGERIARFRGTSGADPHTPEDWLGSVTTVAGSDGIGLTRLPDGRTLRSAVADDPIPWLGAAHVERFGTDPALLTKLLDAGERLPVHVHPDDDFARSHLGCPAGKTESWIILDAEPGATVHLGFHSDVPPGQLAAWVAEQAREEMLAALHALAVRAGDTVFVPAGFAHAIGPGILLLELQQNADLSLLLEYAGFALDGERDGHLGIGFDAALGCVRHDAVGTDELDRLVGRWDDPHIFPAEADRFFRAERYSGNLNETLDPGMSILVVASGEVRVSAGADGHDLDARAGSTVLVPHGAGPVGLHGAGEVLRARPPVSVKD